VKPYLDLLKDIRAHGAFKADRTGTGTYSVFGRQLRVDLNEGFPALTTKRIFMKGVIHELLWFLQGNTNIKYLQDMAFTFGMSGPMPMESWDQFMAHNGFVGRGPTDELTTRSLL
jgi:thymidylate synthase